MNTIVNEATKLPLPPASPAAQHLIHVICLPLQLKRKGKPITHIDDAVQGLTASGSLWRETDGPLLTELTDEQRWQARVYFHPFVRGFLFDAQRSRWLKRSDVKSLRVTLPKTYEFVQVTVQLTVLRCQLVLFQPDIASLLLELDYTATGTQPALQVHELQRLLDRLRRVYPPYFGCDKEGVEFGGHCADSVQLLDTQGNAIGDTGGYAPGNYQKSLSKVGQLGSWKPGWSAHWKTLLAPLHTDNTPADDHSIGIRQFGDDRAAIMTYVAFKDPRALNRGQWARLCFADDHGGDPLPYAESFLDDFEQKHCYDRYWYTGPTADPGPDSCDAPSHVRVPDSCDAPSRVLNCSYAFSYVGRAQDWFFEQDPTGALFTFRHIYVAMGVIAHMQRAALLAASHRLTHMVKRDASGIELPDPEEVRSFYKQFVEFTQTYWFDEVTPQEQGQQIFTQWQTLLRTKPLYDEVRQELRDLAEHSELLASRNEFEQSKQLNVTVGVLGVLSLALTAMSVVAGILGMNPLEAITLPIGIVTVGLLAVFSGLAWRMFHSKEVRPLALSVLFGRHSSHSGNPKP